MKTKQVRSGRDKSGSLLFSIILVFCVLAVIVFSVSAKITKEMSASAVQNLSESLDLMKGTIEAILTKEAEFQQMVAREIAVIEDPEQFILSYDKNQTMVKMSLIRAGETEGKTSDQVTGSQVGTMWRKKDRRKWTIR